MHRRLAPSLVACQIQFSSHSLLVVRLRLQDLDGLVLVEQAPTAVAPQEELSAWWNKLDTMVQAQRDHGEVCFALLDANARVGSVTSPFIGDLGLEGETTSGMLLHQVFASLDTCLSATTVASAVEQEHWTWMSGHGNRHRIDYVAVPAELLLAALAV